MYDLRQITSVQKRLLLKKGSIFVLEGKNLLLIILQRTPKKDYLIKEDTLIIRVDDIPNELFSRFLLGDCDGLFKNTGDLIDYIEKYKVESSFKSGL